MKGENEAVHFYGGEACLRVIFRDYSYWIRLKDQNSIKESIESQKAQALEFVKTNLKKTVLKKADKDFFINLIEDMSKKYLDLPIEIEKMDESDFALLKKALLHIVENPKKSAKNMEDILLPQGKYHIPAVQANFYFWILQMFDPSLYIGFNDNLENKLIKTHLLKWDSLADDITRFSCLCELMKIVKRVRPAYDAFDFMSALDFAVDTKGVVYLDQMLNDVIREEVKLNDINTRRDERLKEAKTRRELKKLQEEAEKARRTYEAEKKEKEKTEKVKAISEAASLESAKKSDATSKSDKSAKPSHTSADHTADASMVPMDSVFDVFEKSGIKFTTVARFLKPQISKRLSKIHTSLKNIRPFNIDSAENYANTLYWYWIDWLWKFIVQQKRSLKMDLSNIPEVSGIDNKTLAVIGAVRELMAEEGMTPNFDEIKYKLIMELKALVHSGSIKLKNYEMTDFTDVPVIDKKSSSESVQSKEDKNRAADFKKYCKQAQACVKCPLIPNIKCNIFNDGSDGYGKITAISLGGSQKDIINARIFLIADLPASDRSDFTDNSQENIFLRAIKGTGLNPKDFAGTFIAKCSAIGDKINRTMMSNCMDHLKREIELISPEAIIVLGENAGNHLKLEKGKWSKFNSKDIYLVKNSQDIYKEKINPEGLVKEILQAFAKIS
jgi:uracil-DNA glycosylase